jgi:hypothetical protein
MVIIQHSFAFTDLKPFKVSSLAYISLMEICIIFSEVLIQYDNMRIILVTNKREVSRTLDTYARKVPRTLGTVTCIKNRIYTIKLWHVQVAKIKRFTT